MFLPTAWRLRPAGNLFKQNDMQSEGKKQVKDERTREERAADALRENLRRRKAQQQARAEGDSPCAQEQD